MANKKIAPNVYLKGKNTALQVRRTFSKNRIVGYQVDALDLRSLNLKPKTIKFFKERKDALKFAMNK